VRRTWAPLLLAAGALLGSAAPAPEPDIAGLRALDARQKAMVAAGDVDGLAALASPDLRINAPVGRVLDHHQFIAMMRSGQIAAEAFERTVESATLSGPIGIVMGREIFTPTAASELGRRYGARPLQRRYTNLYLRQGGRWRWLARHANVVPDQP
jgi:hypothetical protein